MNGIVFFGFSSRGRTAVNRTMRLEEGGRAFRGASGGLQGLTSLPDRCAGQQYREKGGGSAGGVVLCEHAWRHSWPACCRHSPSHRGP